MPALTIQQAFDLALQHHQAGRLSEAEALYRQILAREPKHPDALHFLGVAACQFGQHEAAVAWIGKAIEAAPHNASAHSNLGEAYRLMNRPEQALAALRRALELAPDFPEALNNLAGVLAELGQCDEAITACRRAIRLRPDYAEAYNHLGNALAATGQPDEAIAAYRRAIEIKPGSAEAYVNLGDTLRQRGQVDDAVEACRRAIEIAPANAVAWNHLGNALQDSNRVEQAIEAYRQALEINGNYAAAGFNLGCALRLEGRRDDAITAFTRVLNIAPHFPGAQENLGGALTEAGRLSEAAAAFGEAIRANPDRAELYVKLAQVVLLDNKPELATVWCRRALEIDAELAVAQICLGDALLKTGGLEESRVALERAAALRPQWPEIFNKLGNVLYEQGYFNKALSAYQQSLSLEPGSSDAKMNSSLVRLLCGNFAEGLPAYEARWDTPESIPRSFSAMRYDGRQLTGERVLIHAEQGFGDSIQFVRYAQSVTERGGEVIVECQQPLAELFRTAQGVRGVIAADERLPDFDFHLPMLSQPLVFQTTLESIPRQIPYLFADSSRRQVWTDRLGSRRAGLRVGLAWAGSPKNRRNRVRNIALNLLLPVLAVENTEVYSLQIGPGSEQLREISEAVAITDYTQHTHDFADTAALMMELDLMISVDTAVAHLAGALGRPVWTLLPFVPDWRWGLEGETTPWYPTMRLFRQPRLGDWDSVIRRVTEELRREGGSKDAGAAPDGH